MKKYHFDFLEKIRYTAELLRIQLILEGKLDDFKKKHPAVDVMDQELIVNNLVSIYTWLVGLFEQKEMILHHNFNLQKLVLELRIKNINLEEQLKISNLQNSF